MPKKNETYFNNNSHKHRNTILSMVAVLFLACFLYVADKSTGNYMIRIIRICGVYSIAVLALNLINGFTGQFSLGHGGFMAIGAYVTSLFIIPPDVKEAMYYVEPIAPWVKQLQAPFFIALILGGLVAALAGFLIGFPVLRLRGDYLAIATLGFSEIIRVIITNTTTITNSSLGIKNIPDTANVWWTTIAVALVVVFMLRLMKTSYGRAFKAIRDDETAAESMGISLFKHKMLSFVISCFFTGISGGLLASVIGAITPTYFRFTLAYEILLIVVLGGLGSVTGSIVGACLITIAKEFLRFLDKGFSIGTFVFPEISGMRMLVFSVLLMAVVLFRPEGLLGSKEFSWDRLFSQARNVYSRLKKLFSKKTERGVSN